MLYGCDLLDGFSSVEELCWDDAFAKSVVGSQGNKEDPDQRKTRNVSLRRCVLAMKGKNGKITCDRGVAGKGEDDREISRQRLHCGGLDWPHHGPAEERHRRGAEESDV